MDRGEKSGEGRERERGYMIDGTRQDINIEMRKERD